MVSQPKPEGSKEMITVIEGQLIAILQQLSQVCQSTMVPHQVRFGPTPKRSGYNFLVPNPSRKQLISWGNYRTRGSRKYGKNRPCAIVYVDASLLNNNDPVYIRYYAFNAQYGRPNRGQVEIAICQIGDSDYALALRALTEAARNLLSGTRYNW